MDHCVVVVVFRVVSFRSLCSRCCLKVSTYFVVISYFDMSDFFVVIARSFSKREYVFLILLSQTTATHIHINTSQIKCRCISIFPFPPNLPGEMFVRLSIQTLHQFLKALFTLGTLLLVPPNSMCSRTHTNNLIFNATCALNL